MKAHVTNLGRVDLVTVILLALCLGILYLILTKPARSKPIAFPDAAPSNAATVGLEPEPIQLAVFPREDEPDKRAALLDAGHQSFLIRGCFTCHAMRGVKIVGGDDRQNQGPDLSNLSGRSPVEIAESIWYPSAKIAEPVAKYAVQSMSKMPSYKGTIELPELTALVYFLIERGRAEP